MLIKAPNQFCRYWYMIWFPFQLPGPDKIQSQGLQLCPERQRSPDYWVFSLIWKLRMFHLAPQSRNRQELTANPRHLQRKQHSNMLEMILIWKCKCMLFTNGHKQGFANASMVSILVSLCFARHGEHQMASATISSVVRRHFDWMLPFSRSRSTGSEIWESTFSGLEVLVHPQYLLRNYQAERLLRQLQSIRRSAQDMLSSLHAPFWFAIHSFEWIHTLLIMKFGSFASVVIFLLPTCIFVQLSGSVGPVTTRELKRAKVRTSSPVKIYE